MKVVLIQPEYGTDFSRSEEYFEKQMALLDAVDESADLIVLPESADTPCLAKGGDQRREAYERFNAPLLRAASAAKKTPVRFSLTSVDRGSRLIRGDYIIRICPCQLFTSNSSIFRACILRWPVFRSLRPAAILSPGAHR